MTEEQLDALGPALDDFLRPYLFCCGYAQSFAHLHTYCKGLLSDLQRKTVEPIALASGCAVRTLQEFLRDHLWDFAQVRQQLQSHVAAFLPTLPADDLGTVGLIDETSAVKSGNKTPGVQRQYLGCVGKVANGIVTVHLGVCKGRYKTLFDAELYLSEEWAADKQRREEAGIPQDMVHRPKWKIALEEVDRAMTHKVPFDWLTFDEEYGKAPEFVRGLDDRKVRFVGEVPTILSCLAAAKLWPVFVCVRQGDGAHVLAATWLTPPREGRDALIDLAELRRLLGSGQMLAVECTGFAEGVPGRPHKLSFPEACAVAADLLRRLRADEFRFALEARAGFYESQGIKQGQARLVVPAQR